MRRVFEVDVLECPECGGAMRILAAIHPPEAIRAILDCVGLASRPPPVGKPGAEAPTGFDEGVCPPAGPVELICPASRTRGLGAG